MKICKICYVIGIFLFFLGNYDLMSQTDKMSVASFRMLDGDLTARVNPVKNNNDLTCALIKIVTTEKGFVFEPDAMGVCESRDTMVGEIWLFVAPGSQRITIKHPQLGVLRNYFYPMEIKGACTYEMVLTTAEIIKLTKERITSNYLVMNVTPPNAAITIDGKLVVATNGQVSKMFDLGQHTYQVTSNKYNAATGSFAINADSTTMVTVDLKPNFGSLKVRTLPEDAAAIFIDNEQKGFTPYQADELLSRTYRVQVAKEMYLPVDTVVEIVDNQTSTITLTMKPDFATPRFVCEDAEAEIWVNDVKKGNGSWSERLPAGVYKVEARRLSHRNTMKSVTLKNGDNQIVTIPSPMAITGMLNVNSTPVGADILLNGKNYGKTPRIIKDVLVGDYTLRLEKNGCTPYTQAIVIEENQTLPLEVKLETGKPVMILSEPAGAAVTIDGYLVGNTPLTTNLDFGSHRVQVTKEDVKKEETITVTENGKTEFSFDVHPYKDVTFEIRPHVSTISIDGNSISTDAPIRLAYGEHVVDIKTREAKLSRTIEVTDETHRITIDARPYRRETFLTANAAFSVAPQYSFGLTFGQVWRWGYYVSFMSNYKFKALQNKPEDGIYIASGKMQNTRISAMAGLVVKFAPCFSMHLGVGYGYRARFAETTDGKWAKIPENSIQGADVALGMMGNIKGFVLLGEVVTTNFKTLEYKLGIGFAIK